MMTYNEAKKWIADKGLKDKNDYDRFWERYKILCRHIGLPRHPEKYYSISQVIKRNKNQ